MEELIPIIAILAVFGSPVVIVREILRHRERRHQLEVQSRGLLPAGQTAAAEGERKVLLERIANLETIVCGVDFELNQKLSKLIDERRMLEVAPAPALAASRLPRAAGATGGPRAHPHRPSRRAATPAIGGIAPGDVLANRYRIERELGRGGMGAVYLAHDEVLGERVALKVIAAAFAADGPPVERFRREVAAARKVTHPNVIRIHDLVEAGRAAAPLDGVLRRPDAGRAYLGRAARCGSTTARDILGQICDGLGAAHDAGVIHRDLKPEQRARRRAQARSS